MFLNWGTVAVFACVAQYNFIVVCWKHILRIKKKNVCSLLSWRPFFVNISSHWSSSLHLQIYNLFFFYQCSVENSGQILNMSHAKLITAQLNCWQAKFMAKLSSTCRKWPYTLLIMIFIIMIMIMIMTMIMIMIMIVIINSHKSSRLMNALDSWTELGIVS